MTEEEAELRITIQNSFGGPMFCVYAGDNEICREYSLDQVVKVVDNYARVFSYDKFVDGCEIGEIKRF